MYYIVNYYLCSMKKNILCPRCIERGVKPKILGRYEISDGDIDMYLWCKKCNEEVHVKIKCNEKEQ